MTPSTIENTEAVNPDGELRQGLFAAQAARIVELQAEIASRQEEVDELKAVSSTRIRPAPTRPAI